MKHFKQSHPDWFATPYGQQRNFSQKAQTQGSDRADVKLLVITPGKSTSHHFHLLRKSWFYVIDGHLRVSSAFENWQLDLTTGDLLELDPGEDHCFLNMGAADAQVLEVGSPGHIPHDKISVQATGVTRSAPPGKFWRTDSRLRLKVSGVFSMEAACHCQTVGVDAIGFDLVDADWSHDLDRLDWVQRLPFSMSRFLVTHLTQPHLVSALLQRLGCDTLQWCGTASEETLRTLYSVVHNQRYRIVHTVVGSHTTIREEVNKIKPWVSLLDGLVWDPGSSTETENLSAGGIILDTLELPWVVSMETMTKDLEKSFKNSVFLKGIDAVSNAWHTHQEGCGESFMDLEKIHRLLRLVKQRSVQG